MIDFNFKLDVKTLALKLQAPVVEVGIFRDEPLFGWKKNLVPLMKSGGSQRANAEDPTKRWGTMMVSDSFASLVEKTPLDKVHVSAELKRTGQDILIRFFRSNQTGKDIKMYANNCSAVVKKAYLNMARRLQNNPERIKEKGHKLYAIGTGQTFRAIKGRVKKN